MTRHLEISGTTRLTAIIGDPVSHSLSPLLHNLAYALAKMDVVMIAATVKAAALPQALGGMRALGITGFAVTMPHKETILPLLDHVDPIALEIGAVNTAVNRNGKLIGFNTDWIGIQRALERVITLSGKRVAILGAGGTAVAATYACLQRDASVTIFNRTIERAEVIKERFSCDAFALTAMTNFDDFDIIINTTSVGMAPNVEACPIAEPAIRSKHTVFDAIYSPLETKLLEISAIKGAQVISGIELFIEQGLAQLELHTGVKILREEIEDKFKSAILVRPNA